VSQKNVSLYFCLQLWQILTDYQNFFTVEFGNKFATKCYIVHHTLPVLLHYLAKSELLILLFASTINASAVIFEHENEAVFTHLIFTDPGIKINGEYIQDVLLKQEMLQPGIVQFLATSFFQ